MSSQCTFIILGATGDLAKRKLLPAIYQLISTKKIQRFAVVGVALPKGTATEMLEPAREFIGKTSKSVWQKLVRASYYFPFDFYDPTGYQSLKNELATIERKHRLSGNRLFYLATMPEHFATITKYFAASGMAQKENGAAKQKEPWARIVYEKPFGYDLTSAKHINKCIARVFSEKQIFRIDHYLGKEVVGDIALVRFTNRIFEPLWSKQHIDSVQIIMKEKIGIEGRGAFYDSCGAIRDMVQSHLLQVLALVAMESPKELSGKYIRDAKAAVLKKVRAEAVVAGQYKGYRKEKNVKKNSSTETFGALKFTIHNPRWSGVPFYVKTGKCLDRQEMSIHIKFKMVKCLLSKSCPSDSNYLTIQVQPDEGFYLELNSKIPGVPNEVQAVIMNYCHSCLYGPNTPEAYQTLIVDAIRGDQSVFLRSDEIELSWKVIDEAMKKRGKVYSYKCGSEGPKELTLLDPEKKIRWRA